MKAVVTGNRRKDLCLELVPLLEERGYEVLCLSRETGFDFSSDPYAVMSRVLEYTKPADLFVNLYANYFFNASILAQKVYQQWSEGKNSSSRRMINIGSTTDRVQRGKTNLYHYEKRILREISSGMSLVGVWDKGPKVSHLSFGTLENRSEKNPDRNCMSMKKAAQYIVWLLDQPEDLHVNELSVDPVQ